MGNKCCSKRQSDEFPPTVYKVDQNITGVPHLKPSNLLDSRYTPDPNRGGSKINHHDIIRPGGMRRE